MIKSGKEGVIFEWDFSKSKKLFEKIKEKVNNPQTMGLWNRLTRFLFMSWIAETFRSQGARRGHKAWKPLSPGYKAYKTTKHKTKHGMRGPYSGKALIKTGHLQASFVIGSFGNVYRQGKTQMFFGTRIPYAHYHQDPPIPGKPPKREMVFITDQDRNDIEKMAIKWVVEGLF